MNKKSRKQRIKHSHHFIRQHLRDWYQLPFGQMLVSVESQLLDSVLSNLFGYYLLQLGILSEKELLSNSRISQCIILDNVIDRVLLNDRQKLKVLAAHPEALPLLSDCLDVVVLHHSLEFSEQPHQVLREVDRVLVPEGHIVVLGFNPWSLLLFWRLLLRWRGLPPWCGRFISLPRLKDWVALLGYEIVYTTHYLFRPPLQHEGMMDKLVVIETLGQKFWPALGGGYVFVARKKITTLTPIRPRWRPRRSFIPAGIIER